MIKLLSLPLLLCFGLISYSQKPKIDWGEEFRLKKGSTNLDVVYADNSGVYLQESHMALKSYFVISASMRLSGTLIKLDKSLNEVFRNDFNKELKGKEFEQFFVFRKKVMIVASDYNRKEKTLGLFVAEINNASGELASDWQPLVTFQKDEKNDDIDFKVSLNSDSTKMIIVSSVTGKEKNTYQVQEFDSKMKSTGKATTITNEFEKNTYELEDVLYTLDKKIWLVGRVYEYQEGKRKKSRFLDFANYNIRMYDNEGKQQAEVNTSINGKWLINTKVVQKEDKDVLLAAFYNNTKRGKTIDGMLVQRIDHLTGKVLTTSEKEINNSMLTTSAEETPEDEDDEKESRSERKERERLDKIKDEGEAFSRYMQFKNIFYTADQGVIVLAEKYHFYVHTTTSYTPATATSAGSSSTTSYSVYECGDLLMCKIDKAGDINWMQVLPKEQREVNTRGAGGINSFQTFFVTNNPLYASFGAIDTDKSIHILFNDNPKNATVLQPGQRVKTTTRFGKSDCFIVTVDKLTGKYTRRPFYSNTDVPTSMPGLGAVIGSNMYIVGREDRVLGKTKIAVAKITLN